MGNESGITLLAAVARGLDSKAASAYCMYGVAVPHRAAPWTKLGRLNQTFWMDIFLLHLEQTKTGLELRATPPQPHQPPCPVARGGLPRGVKQKTPDQTHSQNLACLLFSSRVVVLWWPGDGKTVRCEP